MKKLIDGSGFLTKEGESCFKNLNAEFKNIFNEKSVSLMSEQELLVLGSILKKMVNDHVGDAISVKIKKTQTKQLTPEVALEKANTKVESNNFCKCESCENSKSPLIKGHSLR